jgi:predicted RNA binding protein YcfA (HicA-like mRNA interferase family)
LQKRPVVSSEKLLKVLVRLGYEVIRQRGSHIRLRKPTASGDHNITILMHDELAKGTLIDILSQVSIWNGISEDDLIEMIKQS